LNTCGSACTIATRRPGRFEINIEGQLVDPLSVKRRLTCILAADAVGYSSQMGRDEEGTVRVLSAHRAVIDGIIAFHGGRIMSTAGDSVLAEFSSAVEAVRCAVEIQEALKTRNDSLPEVSRMQFRVGVNLGDVVVKNEDLLGDGVNVAARLESIAEPGGICISSSVYDQITGKLDLGFQDIGEQALKNISRPIRAYRVSGTAVPGRPAPPTRSAMPKPGRVPWGIGAVVVAAIAAVVAWQAGWIRFGSSDSVSQTKTAPAASAPLKDNTATSIPADASAARTPGETDVQRIRSEAEALKRQAEAELARARADADVSRAARQKADSEVAATRIRAQAEADAVRIRSDAEAAAARARTEAEAQVARNSPTTRKADVKSGDSPAVSSAPSQGSEKASMAASGATGSAARFDGAWNVTIVCATTPDGAMGYKFEFVAQVKDGFLRGDHGIEGNSSWLRLEGQIQPDGSSRLDARGITGDPKNSINGIARGSPVGYHVAARFEGSSGNGKRLELRACDLRFAKQ
jgi:class 3 adenylate cyclase